MLLAELDPHNVPRRELLALQPARHRLKLQMRYRAGHQNLGYVLDGLRVFGQQPVRILLPVRVARAPTGNTVVLSKVALLPDRLSQLLDAPLNPRGESITVCPSLDACPDLIAHLTHADQVWLWRHGLPQKHPYPHLDAREGQFERYIRDFHPDFMLCSLFVVV